MPLRAIGILCAGLLLQSFEIWGLDFRGWAFSCPALTGKESAAAVANVNAKDAVGMSQEGVCLEATFFASGTHVP